MTAIFHYKTSRGSIGLFAFAAFFLFLIGGMAIAAISGAVSDARDRRIIRKIFFGKFSCNQVADDQAVLDEIYTEDQTAFVTAQQAAVLPLGGKDVKLIYGTITRAALKGVGVQRCAFALVPTSDATWFQEQSQLFEPVVSGTRYSLFSVKSRKLSLYLDRPIS